MFSGSVWPEPAYTPISGHGALFALSRLSRAAFTAATILENHQ
jgi:hypothetical protein